ncbi:MBL fold metallo-hydrolase [Planococcus sp. ISL-110]|uniref:MBL fold metallo-hydrolase n=1 Tax=Planococcus sp. ISL-110 TaxID=2819167 RepID=UPI001BE8BFF7|nr:MBL fold metallo-hydrolase [Planococcus sp. ISL-110]MBT2571513.1 MBL fold metallo-hydrolase [Planococcus sp. ISL-110]
MLRQLQQEGIKAEDIQTIIITHGHLDHIGGLSRRGNPVFSNAEHLITAEEWNYWSERPETMESRTLAPLKDHITFVQSGCHICPGISVNHTPGHTEGHLTVSIESQGTRLLAASDPVTLSHPASYIAAELDLEKGMETRQSFLQQAYTQSVQIFACHYPFPGLGGVKKSEGQWSWVTLDN